MTRTLRAALIALGLALGYLSGCSSPLQPVYAAQATGMARI